jgi:parallel beta-helix repeat protein
LALKRIERVVALACAGVIVLAALSLAPGVTNASRRALGHSSILGAVNEHLNPFRTRHSLLQCGLPVYDLKIDPDQYRGILQVVEEAKRAGKLTEDLKQWAKAEFIHEGRIRDVKLRVRGDNANHWAHDRRSWRIRFPKDDPLDGQREINLIVTADGKAITEAFTNAVFHRLGSMTLRDGYIVLRINGVPQGVYYQLEHWDPALAIHHERPDGTVFHNPRGSLNLGGFAEQLSSGSDTAWQALQVLLDYEAEPTQVNFRRALAVTDVQDYLRFVAGTSLFCADHTSPVTDNHRLFFDPTRGTFRRIPYDLEPTRIPAIERFEIGDWHATFDVFARWPMSNFRVAVLRDVDLRLRRDRILWELVRDDSLLELFDQVFEPLHPAFWADVMDPGDVLDRLDAFRETVRHNVRRIRHALSRNQADVAVRWESVSRARLDFAINNSSGMMLRGLQCKGGAPGSRWRLCKRTEAGLVPVAEAVADDDGTAVFSPLTEMMHCGTGLAENGSAYLYDPGPDGTRYRTKPLRTVIYPVTQKHIYELAECPEGIAWHRTPAGETADEMPVSHNSRRPARLSFDAVNPVTDQSFSGRGLHSVFYSALADFPARARWSGVTDFLRENPAFRPSPIEGDVYTVVLPADTHSLERIIVMPEGVGLRIEPGARLEMGAGAAIVCFGPIVAEGREDAPIIIRTRADVPWSVIASVGAGRESVFRHVDLAGGGSAAGITVEGIFFTGALAVHDGDAVIENCRFTRTPAEDAVNLKNGRARVRSTLFSDNASDGLDLDFVTGSVTASRFVSNGGDGLDVSGSRVHITGNRIEHCGDKGISVGEHSDVRIANNLVLDNTTGIAVKDSSDVQIEHCTLIGNQDSVAVFRKKPVFGGGHARLRSCILLDTAAAVSKDERSTIQVENCLGPEARMADGFRSAPPDYGSRLRSNGFVANLDPSGTPARGSENLASAPGIVAPLADLP